MYSSNEQGEPWRLARQPEQEAQLNTVLYSAAEAMRLLAIFLAPFMPNASNRIIGQLGLRPVSEGEWVREGAWGSIPLTSVVPRSLLFPRIETM
jgi:methionyl-tRNA synthetase